MAEINNNGGSGHGKVRARQSAIRGGSRRGNVRLDMTPMVDLAFLLLTFFILASTLSKPQVMQLALPEKPRIDDNPPELKSDNVLNLVLGSGNRVFWYRGEDVAHAQLTDYSAAGLRKLLIEHRNNRKLWIFVKPVDQATFGNVVDVLDEMSIVGNARYSLADATPLELQLAQAKQRN